LVLLLFLLLAGTGGGFYVYCLWQWQAAHTALNEDRQDEARSRLELCLKVWPRSVPVHLLAARVARLRGDFESAEAHLNSCLQLHHGATEEIQLEFLLMRAQRGEEDAVAPALLLYVEHNSPESPIILKTLAFAYLHNIRYRPAYDCLNRWVALAPSSAEPYRWRGWLLERLFDMDGAMRDYRQALALDPELVPVRLRLAELYLEKADAPAALPHLERLLRQFPNRPDVMARMGQCRDAQGETDEARHLMEAAVKELPNDTELLNSLGKLDLQTGKPKLAERWARQVLKLDPADTKAEYTLAAALHAQGRFLEAAVVRERHRKDTVRLKRVIEVLQKEADNPDADPDALSEVGQVFLKTRERIGLYWLHRALEHDPEHQATHEVLAEYYEKKGDRKQAALHQGKLKKAGKGTAPSTAPARPAEKGASPTPGH
jgi:Tfp pilus assembly protein PilF